MPSRRRACERAFKFPNKVRSHFRLERFALHDDAERIWDRGERPGSQEVDAGVGAAADALQVQAEARESGLAEVFVVRADVRCGSWRETALLRVAEEGGEGVMVDGGWERGRGA